jgi:hypothetical protein
MPVCKNCQQTFDIPADDKQYYQRLGLPEPTWCPPCRIQRRMVFRNERNLYPCQCGLCGKNILSMYSPGKPYQVFCRDCWYSDKWEPLDYGRDYNFSLSFFDQFVDLQQKVPRVGTLVAGNVVNSDYCNYLGDAKDSYLCFGSIFIENCLFGNPYYCKDCVDSLLIRDCELCYECITSEHLYHCFYCQDCFSSNNLFFCYDCKGCSDCIGCAGLRNVNHHIFNKQYSEAEYNKFKESLNFCDQDKVEDVRAKLAELKIQLPRRYLMGVSNSKVSGDYINESKNSYLMFDVKRCEDSKYCAQTIDLKDCYDNNYTEENELCCDYICSWRNYRTFYSVGCYQCNDVYYSDLCDSSKNLFGCVIVRKKQYCILNKQYSEAEYNQLLTKISEQMKARGEWGDFFPVAKSPFLYNETVAQDYFPLTEAEAQAKGWSWKPKDLREYQLQVYQIPADIKDVPENIINEILACANCGKNFKIIKQELNFYKNENLPIPVKCPTCRHLARMSERNPRQLWSRKCDKCGLELQTTYTPERLEKVYCEECYQKEIY